MDVLLGVIDMWSVIQGIAQKLGNSLVILKTPFGLVPCGMLQEQQDDVEVFSTSIDQLN